MIIEELLTFYLGPNSHHYKILTCSEIKPSFLITFLGCALSIPNVDDFNDKLDIFCAHLYMHASTFEAIRAILEALKFINNLMFNHSITLPNGQLSAARDFYVASKIDLIDPVVTNKFFETALSKYVIEIQNKLMSVLHDSRISSILNLPSEGCILWRRQLNLPITQWRFYSSHLETLIIYGCITESEIAYKTRTWAEKLAELQFDENSKPLWCLQNNIVTLKNCNLAQLNIILETCKDSAVKFQIASHKILLSDIIIWGKERTKLVAARLAQSEIYTIDDAVRYADLVMYRISHSSLNSSIDSLGSGSRRRVTFSPVTSLQSTSTAASAQSSSSTLALPPIPSIIVTRATSATSQSCIPVLRVTSATSQSRISVAARVSSLPRV